MLPSVRKAYFVGRAGEVNMTNEDAVKWLGNLRQDIGQLRYEGLWHYEQAIVEIQELLEEQEAVEPKFKQCDKGNFIWCCGSCGAYMYHVYDGIDKAKEYAKYCRQCGKKVNWK